MIQPREGYILAEKAKKQKTGYEVDLPNAYRDVNTGKVFYPVSITLELSQEKKKLYVIANTPDNIVADEVEDAN